jgi:hypothetical protein
MTERTLLPLRLPSVPRLRLPLALQRGSAGDSARVVPLLRCLEESGVSGVAILGTEAGAWPSSPSLVVIHEAAAPEVRARFLALDSEPRPGRSRPALSDPCGVGYLEPQWV